MRKERMIPMTFLAVLLVAAIALPQAFAKLPHTKNYGNHNQYVPHSLKVLPAPNSTKLKTSAEQSGNDLLIQGADLLSNQLLELSEGSLVNT